MTPLPPPPEVQARVDRVTELVTTMVKALVNHEDRVVVDPFCNGRHVIVSVSVVASDMPFVLGQQGRYADMLRTYARAMCKKLGLKFDLDIFPLEEGSRDA